MGAWGPPASSLLFLSFLLSSGAQKPAWPDAVDLALTLERAVTAHQKGDLDAAIEGYKIFLQAEPQRADVRSNLGAAYARLGSYQAAIEQYRQALEMEPKNTAYRFNLALAYYKSARLSDAVSEFSEVLELQPDHRNALILLADCHFQMGENKKVIELLSPLESEYRDDLAWIYLLGTALIREGRLERGQVLVDRILRQGDSAEAHLMMGTARLMASDFPGALKEFEQAVALNPQLPSVHSLYGRTVMTTGDPEKAKKAFRKELEINPNDYQANLFLGVLLKKEQQYEQAQPYLKHTLLVRPGSLEVKYQLGSLYVATSDLAEAQRVLEEVVEEAPDFIEAHVSLATVYYRLKRKQDGDRHRAIVEKLTAERQSRAPGADEELGPAYRGEDLVKVPKPPGKEEKPGSQEGSKP